METTILQAIDENAYVVASNALLNGNLVAFPTETVYGLGAVATNEQAVEKIFQAKGRPSDNPLIVHIASIEQVSEYVTHIPELAKLAMEAFWPGALTVVLNAKPNVFASNVTAGLPTVGLRIPNHQAALRLLQQVNAPIAAPSSNVSGKPSPTTANHVLQDLDGKIPYIINGGETGIGVESTVVDFTVSPPAILRPGGITEEMLQNVVGTVVSAKLKSDSDAPKSPGMKYAHYAPNAPVYMVDENVENVTKAVLQAKQNGNAVALIAPPTFSKVPVEYYFDSGITNEEKAQKLYAHFRSCNDTNATIIFVVVPARQGVGEALFNRIEKAAANKWWQS